MGVKTGVLRMDTCGSVYNFEGPLISGKYVEILSRID